MRRMMPLARSVGGLPRRGGGGGPVGRLAVGRRVVGDRLASGRAGRHDLHQQYRAVRGHHLLGSSHSLRHRQQHLHALQRRDIYPCTNWFHHPGGRDLRGQRGQAGHPAGYHDHAGEHDHQEWRQHLHGPGRHHAERQHDLLGGHEQFRRDRWPGVSGRRNQQRDPGQRARLRDGASAARVRRATSPTHPGLAPLFASSSRSGEQSGPPPTPQRWRTRFRTRRRRWPRRSAICFR